MPLHGKQSQQPRNTHGIIWKKPTNNTESYYGSLASITLALSIVPTRKVVDSSLKDQSVRTKRSEPLDQVGTRNQVKKNKPRIRLIPNPCIWWKHHLPTREDSRLSTSTRPPWSLAPNTGRWRGNPHRGCSNTIPMSPPRKKQRLWCYELAITYDTKTSHNTHTIYMEGKTTWSPILNNYRLSSRWAIARTTK